MHESRGRVQQGMCAESGIVRRKEKTEVSAGSDGHDGRIVARKNKGRDHVLLGTSYPALAAYTTYEAGHEVLRLPEPLPNRANYKRHVWPRSAPTPEQEGEVKLQGAD